MELPQDVEHLAQVLDQLGVEPNIVAKVRKNFAVDPENPDLWIGLATALRHEGYYHGALETYDTALARFPDSICYMLWSNRGLLLMCWERYEEALDSLRTALAIRPDYTRAAFFMAQTYESLHDFERASELYTLFLRKWSAILFVSENRDSL